MNEHPFLTSISFYRRVFYLRPTLFSFLCRKKEDKDRKEKIVFDLLNEEKKRKSKGNIENQLEIEQAQREVS